MKQHSPVLRKGKVHRRPAFTFSKVRSWLREVPTRSAIRPWMPDRAPSLDPSGADHGRLRQAESSASGTRPVQPSSLEEPGAQEGAWRQDPATFRLPCDPRRRRWWGGSPRLKAGLALATARTGACRTSPVSGPSFHHGLQLGSWGGALSSCRTRPSRPQENRQKGRGRETTLCEPHSGLGARLREPHFRPRG